MIKRSTYRKASDYRRRAPRREPYDVVLIVCEGQKTEPLYLNRLRIAHKLSSLNVEVVSAPGTDPMSIIDFAEQKAKTGDYDKIFCVFDRDGHQTYEAAMRRIRPLSEVYPGRIFAVVSWPCFEFWLLLHFEYCAKPFEQVPRRSSCEAVIAVLKGHIPQYEKGRGSLYDDLRSLQDTAIGHAKRLEKENEATGSTNPSTNMRHLISYLTNLRATT